MDSEERMVDLREGALREVQTLSDEIAHDVRRGNHPHGTDERSSAGVLESRSRFFHG